MKKQQKQQKQQQNVKLSLENLEVESFEAVASSVTGGHGCYSMAHTSCAGGGPC